MVIEDSKSNSVCSSKVYGLLDEENTVGRSNGERISSELRNSEISLPHAEEIPAKKGSVQHEFNVDVSGDSRVQWSDETRQLLYVLTTWKDP
ncbi:hypothetical protein TNCV_1351061 [Trichonephila clavipes]|nr:hypothetical protein TNCV_1351061 [Trichonephila clavipes]